MQVQNLPQNKLKDLDLARNLLLTGQYDTLELLFDSVPVVLSQLIRTAFIPSPGCRFVVADFSAIEARVIAWLAGEKWRMDVFNSHGKSTRHQRLKCSRSVEVSPREPAQAEGENC